LKKEGVKLIGGHTSEGAELSIGFAVNGLIDGGITDANKRAKQGARLEDKLILSKPLGTGTLFAANMQYKAEGQWIQQATEMMLMSNRDAAHILKDANACTDVTGFGLAGHLMEMLKSDDLHAEINLDQLPLLEGARESINKLGVKSTLHDANQRSTPGIDGFTDHPAFPILFDPQTAGGLLAAVDSASAEDLVAQLNASGCLDAKIIGSIKNHGADDGPRITVR
jgi:selenide,water dikinase